MQWNKTYSTIALAKSAMERIPLHSWEMEFSIQYHVTINSQLNDQNSIRYYIIHQIHSRHHRHNNISLLENHVVSHSRLEVLLYFWTLTKGRRPHLFFFYFYIISMCQTTRHKDDEVNYNKNTFTITRYSAKLIMINQLLTIFVSLSCCCVLFLKSEN